MKAKLILLVRATVGIGLIAVILASIDLGEVVSTLTSLDPRWLLVLCVLAVLSRVLKSYKWWLLLRARDISISPWQAIRLYFEGSIMGAFTPGGLSTC